MSAEMIKRAGFQIHRLGFEAIASNKLWFEDGDCGRRFNLIRVGFWRAKDGGWVFSIVLLWLKLMLGFTKALR